MRKAMTVALVFGIAGLVAAAGLGPPPFDKIAPPAPGSFYVDDELYRTVGTPTELPDKGPTDTLYVFTGLTGQTPVAEDAPGDKGYNGGRWQVIVLVFTEAGENAHDPDGDGEVNFQLTNYEQVQHHINVLGHLAVVGPGPRFVCPVIPQH